MNLLEGFTQKEIDKAIEALRKEKSSLKPSGTDKSVGTKYAFGTGEFTDEDSKWWAKHCKCWHESKPCKLNEEGKCTNV